jgi:hypothetical protein
MAEAFDACLGEVELAGHLGRLGQRQKQGFQAQLPDLLGSQLRVAAAEVRRPAAHPL